MTAETGPQHIMVVEDDESLAHWIADYLISHGYMVSIATRGDEAVRMLQHDMPDALILDLNLPAMDGMEVCRKAREFYTNPIVMMTARDTDTDEIAGPDSGADDYLAKPVKPGILLARLRALLRRASHDASLTLIHIDNLVINTDARTVMLFGEPIALSTLEFNLLLLLATHVDQTLSRNALVAEVRGIEYDGFDRSVDICISRLRRKLGDDAHEPRRIKTLRGVGYLLAGDAWKSP